MRDIKRLIQLKRNLEKARNLAAEVGSFNMFYMIEVALLQANEMIEKHEEIRDRCIDQAERPGLPL